ncbi:MAG: LytTR family transcriptional regulator DNA-binding domain-containing protein [Bacteroidota bacterium]|nr:LytTR family transcriptional regulator DNA-binding domain-containing protein [Bacteroidota bacterium]MDP4249136.1 LytTR family transcriptional regulator DNA-binding domain-containing protein [Bacteroidota bacterium]
MKILIIEADHEVALRLRQMLLDMEKSIGSIDICSSVKLCLKQLDAGTPDIIFRDMESDIQHPGILNNLRLCPVVLMGPENSIHPKPYGMNCFGYLNKPVELHKLKDILEKYKTIKNHFVNNIDRFIDYMNERSQAKKRFLVKGKTDYFPLLSEDIVYIRADKKLISLADKNNTRYVVEDYSLSSLEKKLDESLFYRANRKFIINVNYIRRFKPLSKSRVSVELALPVNPEILISRENSIAFKRWLGDL